MHKIQFLLFFLIAYSAISFAQSPVYNFDERLVHGLKPNTQLLNYDAEMVSVSSVLSGEYDSLFCNITALGNQQIPDDCWCKLEFTIPEHIPKKWMLFTGSIQNDIVDLYYSVNNNEYQFRRTGYYTPTISRVEYDEIFNHLLLDFSDSASKRVNVTLYAKYRSLIFKRPELNLTLIQPEYFHETKGAENIRDKFVLGFVIGCVFLMIIVALVNFYFVKDRSFLYIASIAFTCIYFFYTSGSMGLFFKMTKYSYFIIQMSGVISFIGYSFFLRHFILIEHLKRRWLILIESTLYLSLGNLIYSVYTFFFVADDYLFLLFDWLVAPVMVIIYTIITIKLLTVKKQHLHFVYIGNALASSIMCVYFFFFFVLDIDLTNLLIIMLSLIILFFLTAFVQRLWSIQNEKQYFQIAELDRMEEKLAQAQLENRKLVRRLNKMS